MYSQEIWMPIMYLINYFLVQILSSSPVYVTAIGFILFSINFYRIFRFTIRIIFWKISDFFFVWNHFYLIRDHSCFVIIVQFLVQRHVYICEANEPKLVIARWSRYKRRIIFQHSTRAPILAYRPFKKNLIKQPKDF